MAHPMPQTIPAGNMHALHQQKKMPNGSPKTGRKSGQTPNTSNLTKIANDARTGDAVSDESDNEGDDGDSSTAEDEEDDSDEPDDFALPSVKRTKNNAASRLAGLSPQDDDDTIEEYQAVAGVQHDSDDDAYEAVEDISDSEESVGEAGEDNILRSAEQDLIAEFERSERPGTANGVTNEMNGMSLMEDAAMARRLSLQSDDSQQDVLGLNLDYTRDPFVGTSRADDVYENMLEDAEESFDHAWVASWRMPESSANFENGATSSNAQKKVRFEETESSHASSVSSDEDPRDVYPDLFADQDDPALRQQLQLSGMEFDLARDNESVFDFEDEYEKAAFEIDGQSDSDSEMSEEDSDDGDTTDEETAEEQLARVKKIKESKVGTVPSVGPLQVVSSTPAASKRPSPALSRSDSNSTNSQFMTPRASGRPRSGTFVNDPTRASVTADIKGSGVKLVCPSKPPEKEREYWERARQAMGSRDGSPGGSVSWTRATPRAASIPQRPFTAKSTLGTMFDGNLDFLRSNDEHGIAKEFLMNSRKNSVQSSFTSNTLTDGGGSDDSSNVNMAEFVQLSDDSDFEMDDEPSNDTMSPSQQAFFSDAVFESSPTVSRDNAPGLLDHFDQQRGLVSSFRNNQHHARHVSSLAAHPAKRAQTSEANALQKGRRAAANTPMTPARKKRQDLDVTGAGVKKTPNPIVQKHRRSRGSSLSGIHQTLALDRFSAKDS